MLQQAVDSLLRVLQPGRRYLSRIERVQQKLALPLRHKAQAADWRIRCCNKTRQKSLQCTAELSGQCTGIPVTSRGR